MLLECARFHSSAHISRHASAMKQDRRICRLWRCICIPLNTRNLSLLLMQLTDRSVNKKKLSGIVERSINGHHPGKTSWVESRLKTMSTEKKRMKRRTTSRPPERSNAWKFQLEILNARYNGCCPFPERYFSLAARSANDDAFLNNLQTAEEVRLFTTNYVLWVALEYDKLLAAATERAYANLGAVVRLSLVLVADAVREAVEERFSYKNFWSDWRGIFDDEVWPEIRRRVCEKSLTLKEGDTGETKSE